MGGDNLLPSVAHIEKDSELGKKITERRGEIFKSRYLPHLKPFPAVRPMLERMRAEGLTLIVASSAKEDELKTLLEIAGVTDLIEATTSAQDAGRSKPAPDPIVVALKKGSLPPEGVLMLGDTPYDIASASKAGVRSLAVRCGGWGDADLKDALAVYADPADLLARYDSSPLMIPTR
jgi:phosphoglycolate phosphatase-like HAD superfamily hydrolase